MFANIIAMNIAINIEVLTALCGFAFVSSVTPGPNNLMLMTSGANYGIWRTMPHFLGVVFGFALMIVLVGLGLLQIFDAYPLSHEILRLCSIAYLSYLAWKIATAQVSVAQAGAKPLNALQAALFQWVNPKAWAMALTALTVYAPSQGLTAVILVALVCVMVNTPSVFVWVVLGSRLQHLLGSATRLRIFNRVMALMLLATLYPVLVG
jgi:threonine/homoserine/homoserine lactone efflux protein